MQSNLLRQPLASLCNTIISDTMWGGIKHKLSRSLLSSQFTYSILRTHAPVYVHLNLMPRLVVISNPNVTCMHIYFTCTLITSFDHADDEPVIMPTATGARKQAG